MIANVTVVYTVIILHLSLYKVFEVKTHTHKIVLCNLKLSLQELFVLHFNILVMDLYR